MSGPPVPHQAPPPPGENQIPTSQQYGEWARNQRPQGTVYGSRPAPATDHEVPPADAPGQSAPGQLPAGVPAWGPDLSNSGGSGPLPLEASGSLTGHILSQGRPDTPETKVRGSRAIIIVLVTIVVLALAATLGAVLVLSGTL